MKSFEFDDTFILDMSVPDFIVTNGVMIDLKVVARSTSDSYINVFGDGQQLTQLTIPLIYESSDTHARERSYSGTFYPNSGNFNVGLEYLKTSSSGSAWLDYITLNFSQYLRFNAPQLIFRNLSSVGAGKNF